MLLSAVALLALAGVNAAALRLGKLSQHRVNASLLALDLAERLRANPLGAGAGHYSVSADWASQSAVPAPSEPCQTSVSACGSTEMAASDLAQWRWHVRQLLPQGAVQVQSQLANQSPGQVVHSVDIWMAWQEPATALAAPATSGGAGGAGPAGSDESPAAADECPAALSVPRSASVRCSHLRVHL